MLGLTALVAPITTYAQTNVPARAPIKVQELAIYDSNQPQIQSETKFSYDKARALIDVKAEDLKAGVNYSDKLGRANIGYQDINGLNGTRLEAELGSKVKLSGSYQKLETKNKDGSIETKDFSKVALMSRQFDTDLEAEVNSEEHAIAIARRMITKSDSLGLVGEIAGDDENFNRVGLATAHSGKIGYLAYAITGNNDDGSRFQDFRIRGGLGNKVGAKSIGVFGATPNGFFDESIVGDLTDPLTTGAIGNYTALVRGDPTGFDVRYLNGTYSAQIAQRLGRTILMPKFYTTPEKHISGLDIEARIDLGKGFTLIGQEKMCENKKPSQLLAVGYSGSF